MLVKIKGVILFVLLFSICWLRWLGIGNKWLYIKMRVIVNLIWWLVFKRGFCFFVMLWILNLNLNLMSKGNELKINLILKVVK